MSIKNYMRKRDGVGAGDGNGGKRRYLDHMNLYFEVPLPRWHVQI